MKIAGLILWLGTLPCLAQFPDPHSQAWAELPDAGCVRDYHLIPIQITLKDDRTQKPVSGALIRCGSSAVITDADGWAGLGMLLENAIETDSLIIEAPGYDPVAAPVMEVVTGQPFLEVSLHLQELQPVPSSDTALLLRLLTREEALFPAAPWQAYWRAHFIQQARPGEPRDSSGRAAVCGQIFAPLGCRLIAPEAPAGWQACAAHVSIQEFQYVHFQDLMVEWLKMDLLAGECNAFGLLPYDSLKALPVFRMGNRWMHKFAWKQGTTRGEISIDREMGAVYQQVWNAGAGNWTQQTCWLQINGHLRPVLLVQWSQELRQYRSLRWYYLGKESGTPFRGRLDALEQNFPYLDQCRGYWESGKDYWWDFDGF